MAKLVRRHWANTLDGGGLSRRDRRSGFYETYLPDTLTGRQLTFTGETVADAEAAIVQLDTDAKALVDTEALSRLLLRAEAIASSRIEGLEIGARRLLRAEMAQSLDGTSSDVTATEVLTKVDELATGVAAPGVR